MLAAASDLRASFKIAQVNAFKNFNRLQVQSACPGLRRRQQASAVSLPEGEVDEAIMAAPNCAGLLRQARDYELIGSRKTVGGGEGQGSKAQEASPHHLQTLNPARTPQAPRPDTPTRTLPARSRRSPTTAPGCSPATSTAARHSPRQSKCRQSSNRPATLASCSSPALSPGLAGIARSENLSDLGTE